MYNWHHFEKQVPYMFRSRWILCGQNHVTGIVSIHFNCGLWSSFYPPLLSVSGRLPNSTLDCNSNMETLSLSSSLSSEKQLYTPYFVQIQFSLNAFVDGTSNNFFLWEDRASNAMYFLCLLISLLSDRAFLVYNKTLAVWMIIKDMCTWVLCLW